ncbi:MAG: Flp pilus assembly protein CpaB [Desulfobacteraceae bacterium]
MKISKGLGFLLLSIVIGLVATFLIHRQITMKTKPEVAEMARAEVLIAETDIDPGTLLVPRLVRQVSWPADIVPPKAIRNFDEVKERVIAVPVSRGEPLLISKLAPEGSAAGLAGILQPDRLAVTVRTDDVAGVAGFVYPGSRVDVLVTMRGSGQENESYSRIILQNIKVLSTGQVWGQATEQGTDTKDKIAKEVTPKVQTTATLEVTPEQAEILNLASTQGKIRLALRNNLNTAEVPTGGVVTSDLVRAGGRKNQTQGLQSDHQAIMVIKGLKVSSFNL